MVTLEHWGYVLSISIWGGNGFQGKTNGGDTGKNKGKKCLCTERPDVLIDVDNGMTK